MISDNELNNSGSIAAILEGKEEAAVAVTAIVTSNRGQIRRHLTVVAFAVAFAFSAVYMFACAKRGWLPQDDGVLAQSAFRLLNGQLPHRDFVEIYTGGLSYIHALAFRLFGISFGALRICLFLFFLAWLPAVFYTASRFTSAIPAAGITLLCVAWSVPIYPTPMPSWYNLFFAVFGAASLLRYLETGTKRWLFLAGVFGGLSCLVKIIGLYYVAAVLLFFLFREQQVRVACKRGECRRWTLYRLVLFGGLSAFLVALALLMEHRFDKREFVSFFAPAAVLVVLLVWREFPSPGSSDQSRFLALFQMVAPFTAGVLIPIAIFLIPYARSHSLRTLYRGVFAAGLIAVDNLGRVRPIHPRLLLFSIPLLFLLALAVYWKRAATLLMSFGVAAVLAVLLLDRGDVNWAYICWSARALTPWVVLIGAAILLFRPRFADRLSPLRQQQLMLMLALAAVCSLVQFPFSVPIYFHYTAPLTALALLALVSTRARPTSPSILTCIVVFYVVFAVVRVQPLGIYSGWLEVDPPALEELNLPRAGGLKVRRPRSIEQLVATAQRHSANGIVLATPECPDIYFLTGLRNPTTNDLGLRPEEMLRAIRTDGLNVVVVKQHSTFSNGLLTPEVNKALSTLFPHSEGTGGYLVRWRD